MAVEHTRLIIRIEARITKVNPSVSITSSKILASRMMMFKGLMDRLRDQLQRSFEPGVHPNLLNHVHLMYGPITVDTLSIDINHSQEIVE